MTGKLLVIHSSKTSIPILIFFGLFVLTINCPISSSGWAVRILWPTRSWIGSLSLSPTIPIFGALFIIPIFGALFIFSIFLAVFCITVFCRMRQNKDVFHSFKFSRKITKQLIFPFLHIYTMNLHIYCSLVPCEVGLRPKGRPYISTIFDLF